MLETVYVEDNFEILVIELIDSFYWKSQQQEEKFHQHNDSATKTVSLYPIPTFEVTMMLVTTLWWRLYDGDDFKMLKAESFR